MSKGPIAISVFTLIFVSLVSFSTRTAIAQTGSWSTHAQLPNPRIGAPAGVIDGKLYVVSGCCAVVGFPHTRFTDMRIYDPATDTWTRGTDILLGVYGSGNGVIDGKLYVAGGQQASGNVKTLQIYDSTTKAWSYGADMPEASTSLAAGVINGKLYVAGGMNASNTSAADTLRIYDPATGKWTLGKPMPTARAAAAGVVVNGQLYVIGGHRPGVATYTTEVEAYDPVSDSWTKKAPLPTARYSFGAGVVQDIIYAVGGYNGSFLDIVEAYDPVADEWSTQDPMPNVHYASAVGVLNGRLHVVSGGDATGAFTGAHDAFNAPVLNTPPTADAGSDQAARPGATIMLNGSASFDDNTPSAQLTYQWNFVSMPSGSTAALQGAGTATPSFVADVFGDYVIELTVTDQGGLHSVPDQVVVGTDVPPTSNAGPDRLVIVGTPVTLEGSGFDPDDVNLAFSWTFVEKPAGSAAMLNNAQSANPTFVPDVAGAYVAELIVSDALGVGTPDQVRITAVTATSYAQTQTQDAAQTLSDLPPSTVATEGNRNALMTFLSQAVTAIQSGDLDEARAKLQQAISRTDGCALRGASDGNGPGRDWITTCAAQQPVYSSLVAALDAFQ